MDTENLNERKIRRMMLEYRYLDMEQDEVSTLSEQYVEKFRNDLIPDGLNPFENENSSSEEDSLDEEKELSEMSSDILNKLYRKITFQTHPDRCDDLELNALFLEATKAHKNKNLPKIIPIFPLSNFIIFPNMTVPLNIFEPRYIQMIDDCMKVNRMIGIIQPKK